MTNTRVLINRRGELAHSGVFSRPLNVPVLAYPQPYIEMNVSENRVALRLASKKLLLSLLLNSGDS